MPNEMSIPICIVFYRVTGGDVSDEIRNRGSQPRGDNPPQHRECVIGRVSETVVAEQIIS